MVLVMDEVDGMSAGDRGGVADLIKTIAKSKARHPSPSAGAKPFSMRLMAFLVRRGRPH